MPKLVASLRNVGMALSDLRCWQSLKLIMRSGRKENKKQKLLETLCNVGMALSDPRWRQSLKLNMRSGRKEKKTQKL